MQLDWLKDLVYTQPLFISTLVKFTRVLCELSLLLHTRGDFIFPVKLVK